MITDHPAFSALFEGAVFFSRRPYKPDLACIRVGSLLPRRPYIHPVGMS
jgi:hypothetical protein